MYPGVKLLDLVVLSFLRNLHTVFHSDCSSLHSHHQHMRVPFSQTPYQHLLFVVFLVIAFLTVVRWYLIVVLIDIFLIIPNIEHLFLCLLVFFQKISIQIFREFKKLGCLGFFVFILNCLSCLYSLDINPLSIISFANIFSNLVDFLSVLSIISFAL